MMTRKLRKSNNSLMFITDHDENSFDQQQQTIKYKQKLQTITKHYVIAKSYLNLIIDSFLN